MLVMSNDTVGVPSSGARRIIAGRANLFLVERRSPSFPLLLRFGKSRWSCENAKMSENAKSERFCQ
jgi:hypothetical protein